MRGASTFNTVALVIAGLALTPVAWGQADGEGYAVRGQDYELGLPGGGSLPPRRADILEVGVSDFGTSVGCDGIQIENIAASVVSDTQQIFEYYSENWQNLVYATLIYSQPTLYNLLNNEIKGFQEELRGLMLSCRQIRNELTNRPDGASSDGSVDAQARANCLSDTGGSWRCNMDETIADYKRDIWSSMSEAISDAIDGLPAENVNFGGDAGGGSDGGGAGGGGAGGGDGGGAGDTGGAGGGGAGGAGGGSFAGAGASTGKGVFAPYPISDITRAVVPTFVSDLRIIENGGDGAEGLVKKSRSKTLPAAIETWQGNIRNTLNEQVDIYISQGPDAVDPSVFNRSTGDVDIDRGIIFELAKLKRVSSSQYQMTLERFTRQLALSRAEMVVSEIEKAVHHSLTAEGVLKEMEDETVEHWKANVAVLRSELNAEKAANEHHAQQTQLLRELVRQNRNATVELRYKPE